MDERKLLEVVEGIAKKINGGRQDDKRAIDELNKNAATLIEQNKTMFHQLGAMKVDVKDTNKKIDGMKEHNAQFYNKFIAQPAKCLKENSKQIYKVVGMFVGVPVTMASLIYLGMKIIDLFEV